MKTVLQRVERAEVRIAGAVVARIGRGVVLLVGVERGDSEADADVTARKIAALRIFAGRTPMDLTLAEVGGACLVVSQFTLARRWPRATDPASSRPRRPRAPRSCTCAWPRSCAPPACPPRRAGSAPTCPSTWSTTAR